MQLVSRTEVFNRFMSDKRTYSGLGEAVEGVFIILDPEEKVAVKHLIWAAFGLGVALSTINTDLGFLSFVLASIYHIYIIQKQSKRGDI